LWRQHDRVNLDIDSSGLRVYGRLTRAAARGIFPGSAVIRVTIPSTHSSAGPEILSLFLDRANFPGAGRFWDCLYQAADVIGSWGRLHLIRGDASFGTGPTFRNCSNWVPASSSKALS
jgi:hypothetical protein